MKKESMKGLLRKWMTILYRLKFQYSGEDCRDISVRVLEAVLLPCFVRFAKKRQLLSQLSSLQNRQRPTFPGSLPPSIISARELNFCVRDGYRCVLPAIVTGFPICSSIFLASQIVLIYLNVLSSVPSKLNNDYALLVLLKPLVKRSTD